MKSFNKSIGDYGEQICLNYLITNNYKILDKNFKCKQGEIDIICSKNHVIIFIEVKSRVFTSFGLPMESVGYIKKKRIIKVSKYYIYLNTLYNLNVRFDVMEVQFNTSNNSYSINHIKNAFSL